MQIRCKFNAHFSLVHSYLINHEMSPFVQISILLSLFSLLRRARGRKEVNAKDDTLFFIFPTIAILVLNKILTAQLLFKIRS